MIKIGLLGFDFKSSNKGCEALSYSFVEMLSNLTNENLEIHVFSYGELGNIPRQYSKFRFVWHRLNMKNPIFLVEMKRIFDSCKCVFDITYGDGFSDIYGKVWNANTDLAKQIANMSKASLVLLPQTYGPFYTKALKKWATHIIKNSYLVFSRDRQSAQEMSALGIGNVVVATDLAFALPYYKEKYDLTSDKRKIGFNVSSLLWDGGHNIKLKVNYREYCRQIVKKYSEDSETEIHIIPHVIDEVNYNSLENDSRVCKILKEEFPCAILAPDFKDPIEAKSYISNMDVFIGARMHSTIGAISAGVATIPFSYSKKFEGLFGNLNYPYVISATKLDTDVAVRQTEHYVDDKDILSKALKKMMPEINEQLKNVQKQIQSIMMR